MASQYVSSPVHGHVVVDTVHQEVQGKEERCIGEHLVDVEEEAMEDILQERPDEVTEEGGRLSLT